MTDACMRTPEAAHYLGISESTLNKTRLTGNGPPFIKVTPRAVAYRKADLDAWLARYVLRSKVHVLEICASQRQGLSSSTKRSISCCEVTPTTFRNFRIDILKMLIHRFALLIGG